MNYGPNNNSPATSSPGDGAINLKCQRQWRSLVQDTRCWSLLSFAIIHRSTDRQWYGYCSDVDKWESFGERPIRWSYQAFRFAELLFFLSDGAPGNNPNQRVSHRGRHDSRNSSLVDT
jgi:hypothetical protein